MKETLYKADIQFNVGKKTINFSIVHNLPQIEGLSIDDAFASWSLRTFNYTAKSLCAYIKSKDPTLIAIPAEEFKDIKNETPTP